MLRKILIALAATVALTGAWLAYTAAGFYLYWSPAEAVSFESGGIRLSGTLIKPAGDGVYPAVVVLHGAGPDTRDGPGYRAHARAMLDAGFAVLVYDKRGSGESGGNFAASGYGDFIADARAAVAFLAARPEIDASRIGLVGASESGWFTPEIAASGGIAFVINKAGPPLDWRQTVAWEVRNDLAGLGLEPQEIERQLVLLHRVWALMIAAAGAEAGSPAWRDLNQAAAELRASHPRAGEFHAGLLAAHASGAIAGYAEKLAYDPRPHLRAAQVPMLYIFAEHDVNVPTEASVAYLEELKSWREAEITAMVLPGVGHTFYSWRGFLAGGYPPGYLATLQDWARRQI